MNIFRHYLCDYYAFLFEIVINLLIKKLPLKANLQNAYLNWTIAASYEELNQDEKSINFYSKVYNLKINNAYQINNIDLISAHKIAMYYEKQKEINKAIEWYLKSANKGLRGSMHNLAMLYENQKNYDQAIYWYKQASKKGLDESKNNLKELQNRIDKEKKIKENKGIWDKEYYDIGNNMILVKKGSFYGAVNKNTYETVIGTEYKFTNITPILNDKTLIGTNKEGNIKFDYNGNKL